jgi:hypothetical protein
MVTPLLVTRVHADRHALALERCNVVGNATSSRSHTSKGGVMNNQQWIGLFGETDEWNRFDHGATWPVSTGGCLAWSGFWQGVEPETRVIVARTIRPDIKRWHTWSRADYGAPCTPMSQQQCDEWAHACGGVEGIGVPIDERDRERRASRRLTIVMVLVAGLAFVAMTAAVSSSRTGGSDMSGVVWTDTGDGCKHNNVTGDVACAVVEGE